MPFHRWDDMKPRNLVKTTDSEGNLVLGEYITVTRQIQPPGKVTRPHTHGCEQMIEILEGTGWFRVGDEEKTVGPGEVVHIPMGGAPRVKKRRRRPTRLPLVQEPLGRLAPARGYRALRAVSF